MHRLLTLSAAATLLLLPMEAWSASIPILDVSLSMRPHCTETDASRCKAFKVLDPTSLVTDKLAVGDLLDLDITVSSSVPKEIQTIRSWLQYDPAILEARNVELRSGVTPLPGEQGIDTEGHLIKIGGTAGGAFADRTTSIARVTFRVKSAANDTTISFYDYQGSGHGHTAVNGEPRKVEGDNGPIDVPCIGNMVGCGEIPTPLLIGNPTKLTVDLADEESQSSAAPLANESHSATTGSNSALFLAPNQTQPPESTGGANSVSPTTGTSFALLQVQGLRMTSQERDIYIGWNALKSSTLKGYNVYYGTVSGQYIQRKGVPGSQTSLILRGLEPGSTYYVSVRALSNQNEESAFSPEVSVVVGNPNSSSAPLSNDIPTIEGNPIETRQGTEITGETGVNDALIGLLLFSAAIGTAIAAHRNILRSRRA